MKRKLAFIVALIAVAAALLAGCSGAGAPTSQASSLQGVVKDNLSAFVLIASWARILYIKRSTDPTPPPTRTEMPDGSLRLGWTNSDGGVCEWFILDPTVQSSAGHGTIRWPDDTMYSEEWEATVWSADHRHSTGHLTSAWSNGASMDYTAAVDYVTHTRQVWEGTARTPEGSTLEFRLDRVGSEQDRLTLNLPDGSHLTLTVPLTIVPGSAYWPRFQEASTGLYTASDGSAMNITLKGTTADAWDSWEIAAANGTTGAFSLAEGLAGDGRLHQDGQTVGSLKWNADGVGTLERLGTDRESLTASATARNLQITHSISNVALLGPSPMY